VSGAADQTSPGTVSVIIPTHNRADSCVRAIESALAQTLPPLEVIVCDDRSTDGTESAISALAANDERVRYLRRTNGPRGPGATRNRALQEARGEFVAFLDDDDEWFAEKLELQVPLLIKSGGLVASNAVRSSGGTYFADSTDDQIDRSELLNHNPLILSSVIASREQILACGAFSEHASLVAIEDYDLALRLSDEGVPMVRLGAPLLHYSDTADERLSGRTARIDLAIAGLFARRLFGAQRDTEQLRAASSKLLSAARSGRQLAINQARERLRRR
jgi:glycosyltransferase involved in cell wall biosynthesis